MAAAGSGVNQPRSCSQLLIQLDLLGAPCTLQRGFPPDGCESEPSPPELAFRLTFSVGTWQMRGFQSCRARQPSGACTQGQGGVALALSLVSSIKGHTHVGYLLCSRPCAGH